MKEGYEGIVVALAIFVVAGFALTVTKGGAGVVRPGRAFGLVLVVLWQYDSQLVDGTVRLSSWSRRDTFETRSACQRAQAAATAAAHARLPNVGDEIERQRVVSTTKLGDGVQVSARGTQVITITTRYECYPDTIDPRR